ncbi:glutaredoxin family protein [Leifsonia poae]|uniref:glutaredoxin family protein n=1 Tax=Leifsonia poae TaxID=110933 RepID=UPI001CBF51EB|nr:glutaredoxin domain-containing protein [Leifsonia poae]
MTSAPETFDRVTMFGAEWCRDCRRSKALFERLGTDYDYIDLESVADGAERAKAISGRTNIPVVVFPDGAFFVEPTDADLEAALAAR